MDDMIMGKTVQDMILDKLQAIEEKVDKLPTKELVESWIGKAVSDHKADCPERTKPEKKTSIAPTKVIKLSPELRSLILKITIIAGVFASGMGGKEVVAMIFGGP